MAGTPEVGDNEFVSINLSNDIFSSTYTGYANSEIDDASTNGKNFDSVGSSHYGGSLSLIDDGLTPTLIDTSPENVLCEPVDNSVFDSDNEQGDGNKVSRSHLARQKLKLVSVGSSNSTSSTNSDVDGETQNRKRSAVDGLLFEIYERYSTRENFRSVDSDNITECSTTSSNFCFASSLENDDTREKLDRAYLETKGNVLKSGIPWISIEINGLE